jgi:CMP-N-acetylneuraminic acid synthetase
LEPRIFFDYANLKKIYQDKKPLLDNTNYDLLVVDKKLKEISKKYEIEYISKIDTIILLQPTSPYRNLKKIKKIITLFEKNISKNFVAVSKFKYNAKNLYEMNETNKKLKRIAVKKKINNL